MKGTQIKLPKEGETMEFKNYKNKFIHPFVIYADFESTLKTLKQETKQTKQQEYSNT